MSRNGRFYSLLILSVILTWPAVSYADASKPGIMQQINTLEQLLHYVNRNYYRETDAVDLYHGAIEGYLSKLDPHSTYIPPEDLQDTEERLQGSFEGIGIFFDIVDDFLTVLSPIEGSPAYRAGLLPGDRIRKIDGYSAVGIKTNEVTERLKGPKGSRVDVSVERAGESELLEFEIKRDRIEVPSVPYAFKLSSDVGYVKVNRFSGHTVNELETQLVRLLNGGSEKLILDLRGNGGGYLEQAVAVANLFVEKDRLLVYTQGRHPRSREDHNASKDPLIPSDLPLLVLVNSFSASASEIVAGAIQDYDRGLVVGHTTFGKGLVQKQYPLKNGGAVLLTIARYFTPSSRPIQRPYTEDRKSYIRDAHDDYDPNADPDSLVGRPVYYTQILKRKVFGSGGITPDIILNRDSLNSFQSGLLRNKHFLVFAKRQEDSIVREDPTFQPFLERYHPGRREISAFKKLLKELEFEYSEEDFKSNTEFIKKEIKREIAQIRWGARAEGQVRAAQDSQVQQALALFEQAQQLLAQRAFHYNQGYHPGSSDSRYQQVR